jgi:hypothetical protein
LPSQIIEFIKIYCSYTTFEFHARVWAKDKMAKVLLLACFILVGALGFTIGMLINIQKEIPKPIQHNITNKINTTNNNDAGVNKTTKEWNVSYCPYCGAPLDRVEEVPYLIDANGIMHGHIYRVYKCGHRVYMGKDLAILQHGARRPGILSRICKKRGGEVYY